MVIDLSNGSDWQKIYDQFHVAQSIPGKPERHYPIFPILVPATLDNYIIAVNSNTTFSKPSWYSGGKVFPWIDINNSEIPSGKYRKYHPIDINATTFFKVIKLSPYYKLIIEAPRWFVDIHLEVWVFTGQEPTNNVEQQIGQIQTDLVRIESKIDSNSAWGNTP